jgi:hypothetical protein
MSNRAIIQPDLGARVSAWVTVVLSASAAVAVVFGVSLAVSPVDSERLESVLMLPVARQLLHGPFELYGPFSASNRLVIIHAPLYYHMSALLAWPLYRGGLDHVLAALAAGRVLSFLGLGWTLVVAYRLARIDGMPRRAGWWAVLLILASSVVGVMPYTVRPDMLGVALQTTGVLLVLSALRSERPRGIILAAAFAAFGLALCVKQHYVAAPAISTILLVSAWLRGRLAFHMIACGLLTALVLIVVVYGTEELVTGGMMSQSVMGAALAASRVHYGGWGRGEMVASLLVGKSSGLVEIMTAAALASIGARRGTGRAAFVFAATGLVAVIAAWTVVNAFEINVISWDMILGEYLLSAAVFLVIPACLLVAPRILWVRQLDRLVGIYLVAELALVTFQGWMSTGAWLNYGIQAVVFASVLGARGLVQVFEQTRLPRQVIPIVLAAPVVLIGVCGSALTTTRLRSAERIAVAQVLDQVARPATEFFFVDRPGENRLCGRLDLVYDEWLYPVFESIHQVEPRSIWLQRSLTSEGVTVVVNTSASPMIDGLGEPLPRLGYFYTIQLGSFHVWKRYPSIMSYRAK